MIGPRSALRAVVGVVAVVALVVVSPGFAAPAGAADIDDGNGHWPVLQYNHRGDDVKALQWLVKGWGYSPGSVDGVYGSGTRSAIQSWQTAKGLSSDGYMVDADWDKMYATLSLGRPEMKADHIRALQHLLNVKNGAGLSVDGVFGSLTDAAVKNFQSHANTYLDSADDLTVDGIAGKNTWRQLLFHYEHMEPSSSLCNPGGAPGSQNDKEEWGHTTTIGAIEKAGAYFKARNWGGIPGQSLLAFWDTSEEHGGDINGHGSHEVGMDVDTGMVFDDGDQCTVRSTSYTYSHPDYDRTGTINLIADIRHGADFSSNGMIRLIYYNDPYVASAFPSGLVRTTGGSSHDYHIHIRYCTRPNEGHSSEYEQSYTGGTCS